MSTKIQLRNDTSGAWELANPILAEGEMGVETDTNKIKVGNGIDEWDDLPYVAGEGGGDGGDGTFDDLTVSGLLTAEGGSQVAGGKLRNTI